MNREQIIANAAGSLDLARADQRAAIKFVGWLATAEKSGASPATLEDMKRDLAARKREAAYESALAFGLLWSQLPAHIENGASGHATYNDVQDFVTYTIHDLSHMWLGDVEKRVREFLGRYDDAVEYTDS